MKVVRMIEVGKPMQMQEIPKPSPGDKDILVPVRGRQGSVTPMPRLVELARRRILDVSRIVTRTIPLDADTINQVLDRLEQFGSDVRTVIIP